MTNIIQKVTTSDNNSIFLIDWNDETKELTFRSAMKPEHLQKEKVQIIGDIIYTHLYFFHISYLYRFMELNSTDNGEI